jgi:hypothetical protein
VPFEQVWPHMPRAIVPVVRQIDIRVSRRVITGNFTDI